MPLAGAMLSSPDRVIWALLTYTDWCQPVSASIIQVGNARRQSSPSEGIPAGLLETLDERTELRRRMQLIEAKDRDLLFLWYLRQLLAKDIARALGISRRQCFRRRARAIRRLVELGEPTQPHAAA